MKRLQPYLISLSALLLLIPVVARYLKGHPLIPAGEFADPIILISIALGVFTTFLFTKLAKSLTKSPRLQTLLTLLFIINPVFLALFTSVNPLVLAVPVTLFLTLTQHRVLLVFASLVLSFINPVFAILFFAATWRRIYLPATLLAAALAIINGNLIHYPVIKLVEFGYVQGASLLLLLLALLECVRRWPERKPLIPFIILVALIPFTNAALILAGLASAPLAAFLIAALEKRRWKIKEAKPLTLLLISCGLLFLFITHIGMLVSAEPTKDTVALVQTLPGNSVVLTPAHLVPTIERFSTATPLIITEDTQQLFSTRKQADAETIILRHDITYVIITTDMHTQWSHDEDGLLFLLKHSEHFKKTASTDDMDLWRWD